MSFERLKITMTFQLGKGNFGTDGFDTVKLENLRCIVDIGMAGSTPAFVTARLFGAPVSIMNQLSTMGMRPGLERKNVVIIEAGLEGSMAQVFKGSISFAMVRYNQAPDVAFEFDALAGFFERAEGTPGRSYDGRVNVAQVLSDMAATAGFAFDNSAGVSAILDHPHFD
jgi:hypothetical protein